MGGLRELSVQTKYVRCRGPNLSSHFLFSLNDNGVRLPICPDESVESFKLKVSNSDQESSFKFFVFTGVLCFVYGIVVLVAYVFISPTLESHDGIGFKIVSVPEQWFYLVDEYLQCIISFIDVQIAYHYQLKYFTNTLVTS